MPVLTLREAVAHPHNRARSNFLENEGCIQPAPAPKFSKTPQHMGSVPSLGQHAREIMEEIDFLREKMVALLVAETI